MATLGFKLDCSWVFLEDLRGPGRRNERCTTCTSLTRRSPTWTTGTETSSKQCRLFHYATSNSWITNRRKLLLSWIWACNKGLLTQERIWHIKHLIIFTARNSSFGKVMFSEACVKNSVHGGGACVAGGSMCGRGVRGRRDGHCSGWYASYWNAFLYHYRLIFRNSLLTVCNYQCTLKPCSHLYDGSHGNNLWCSYLTSAFVSNLKNGFSTHSLHLHLCQHWCNVKLWWWSWHWHKRRFTREQGFSKILGGCDGGLEIMFHFRMCYRSG